MGDLAEDSDEPRAGVVALDRVRAGGLTVEDAAKGRLIAVGVRPARCGHEPGTALTILVVAGEVRVDGLRDLAVEGPDFSRGLRGDAQVLFGPLGGTLGLTSPRFGRFRPSLRGTGFRRAGTDALGNQAEDLCLESVELRVQRGEVGEI